MWAPLHDQACATECLDDSSVLEPQVNDEERGRYGLVAGEAYAVRYASIFSQALQSRYVSRSPFKTLLRVVYALELLHDGHNQTRKSEERVLK